MPGLRRSRRDMPAVRMILQALIPASYAYFLLCGLAAVDAS